MTEETERSTFFNNMERAAAIPGVLMTSTQDAYDRAIHADRRSRKSAAICAVLLVGITALYLFAIAFSTKFTERTLNNTHWRITSLEVANKTDCSLHPLAEVCMRAVMQLDITNYGVGFSMQGTDLTLEVHGRLLPDQIMSRHSLGRAYLPDTYITSGSTTSVKIKQSWPIQSLAAYSLLRERVMRGEITEMEFDGYIDTVLFGLKCSGLRLLHKRARLARLNVSLKMPDEVF